MSNRDINRAFALLRIVEGGKEPYAPVVYAVAQALIEHDDELSKEILAPFVELAEIARRADLRTITVPLAYFDSLLLRGKLLGREDSKLREEVTPDVPGVVPVDE